eukprot:CAMPEP_0118869938 /NCGR_PEP_ID=MMETSP1163-20130328/13092_1 /TAXON_ID=124430 /ORGANISM="Phaeomonas parva, Strain CCMP2877" /LENGTH=45 /DNA_ID= /DNA_START= /DNA_END= /DNA_ORIENTATION=
MEGADLEAYLDPSRGEAAHASARAALLAALARAAPVDVLDVLKAV